jgi:hypothetical protein
MKRCTLIEQRLEHVRAFLLGSAFLSNPFEEAHDYQGQTKVIQVAFDAFARLQQAVGGVAEDDLRSISISLYHGKKTCCPS